MPALLFYNLITWQADRPVCRTCMQERYISMSLHSRFRKFVGGGDFSSALRPKSCCMLPAARNKARFLLGREHAYLNRRRLKETGQKPSGVAIGDAFSLAGILIITSYATVLEGFLYVWVNPKPGANAGLKKSYDDLFFYNTSGYQNIRQRRFVRSAQASTSCRAKNCRARLACWLQ